MDEYRVLYKNKYIIIENCGRRPPSCMCVQLAIITNRSPPPTKYTYIPISI